MPPVDATLRMQGECVRPTAIDEDSSAKMHLKGKEGERNATKVAEQEEVASRGENIVYAAHQHVTTTRVTVTSRFGRKRAPPPDKAAALPEQAPPPPSPVKTGLPSVANTPTPLHPAQWSELAGPTFNVRGSTYLSDGGVKIPAASNLFRLIAVDTIAVTAPLPQMSVCLHPDERVQSALRREAGGEAGGDAPPFIFAVNIRMPTTGRDQQHCPHLVAFYAVDDLSLINGTSSAPESELLRRFFFGECDEFRDSTFKLLPRIAEGNVIVKKAVGSKPTIMGRKLKQTYVRGDRFLEVVINVESSQVATKIVKMCLGYAKTLVVDMAFILEGKDESCLPERVMGSVRLKNVDFKRVLRPVIV